MTKIVVNRCFGGFSISGEAVKRLAELQGKECYAFRYNMGDFTPVIEEEKGVSPTYFSVPVLEIPYNDIPIKDLTLEQQQEQTEYMDNIYLTTQPTDRTDPLLVQVVEELGRRANGSFASLEVVEIPDDIRWYINEYDGQETIEEDHRSW